MHSNEDEKGDYMLTVEDLKNDKNYHGYAHTLSDAERVEGFLEEKEKYGFDTTEVWSLYNTIVSFTLPRLKCFRESTQGQTPYGMSSKKWNSILDKMIYSFEKIDSDEILGMSEEESIKVKKGLDLFRKYFFQLWC